MSRHRLGIARGCEKTTFPTNPLCAARHWRWHRWPQTRSELWQHPRRTKRKQISVRGSSGGTRCSGSVEIQRNGQLHTFCCVFFFFFFWFSASTRLFFFLSLLPVAETRRLVRVRVIRARTEKWTRSLSEASSLLRTVWPSERVSDISAAAALLFKHQHLWKHCEPFSPLYAQTCVIYGALTWTAATLLLFVLREIKGCIVLYFEVIC